MTLRTWSASVALVVAAGLPFTAHSQTRGVRECDAVHGLEILTVEDRDFVRALCQFSDSAAETWKERAPAEYERLSKLAARILPRSRWEQLVFAQAIPEEVYSPANKPGRVPPGKCAAQWADRIDVFLQKAFDGKEKALTGSALGAFRWPSDGDCEPTFAKLEAEPSGSANGDAEPSTPYVTVALIAPANTKVRAVTTASDGAFSVVRPLSIPSEALNRQRQVFALQIPFGSRYLLLARGSAAEGDRTSFPIAFDGAAIGPIVHLLEEVAFVPVDVQVASDTPLRLFIDGVPVKADRAPNGVHSAYLQLPIDPYERVAGQPQHNITAVVPAANHVLLNHSFDVQRGEVKSLTFDLTTNRRRDMIGLFSVQALHCESAGVDPTRVQARVLDYLKAQGKPASDLSAWANVLGFVSDLKQVVSTLNGTPVGADRGRLNSSNNLATGAAEILRQGFGTLLSVDLNCSRHTTNRWDYAVSVRRFDLEAISHAARDPIRGINVDDIQTTEVEIIDERELLSSALASALARVYDIPFIGLPKYVAVQPFFEPVSLDVEVSTPLDSTSRYHAVLTMLALRDADARAQCGTLEDAHTLRARAHSDELERLAGDWIPGDTVRVAAGEVRRRVQLTAEPTTPTIFLVRAALMPERSDVAPLSVDYRCVDTGFQPVDMWVDLEGRFQATSPRGRIENSRAIAVSIGIDWRRARGLLALGAGIGYAHTVRDGQAPGSWSDVRDVNFDLAGRHAYEVLEHSVFLLVRGELRTTICGLTLTSLCNDVTRRIETSLRVLVTPGLHVISNDLNPALRDFRRNSPNIVPDVGAFVQLGLGTRAETLGAALRLGVGTDRLVDYVRDPARASVARRMLWSGSVEGAWHF
jgi:hypothetical protein